MNPLTFSKIDIAGRGGTRAFYISMTTIDLVYKIGYGMNSDIDVSASTPDIDLYEGEGTCLYVSV